MAILFVEDDENIRQGVTAYFQRQYAFVELPDASGAMRVLSAQEIELCILDIELGGTDGFALCSRIRELYDMPILFLTVRDDEESILHGFSCGADDYVVKPFSFLQLAARIEALLRRSSRMKKREDRFYRQKELLVAFDRKKISYEEKDICLTALEWKLLEVLIANRGCIVTRTLLFEKFWDGKGVFVENNTLTVTMSRLRRKIASVSEKNYIETVHGIGYRWRSEL